MLDPKNAPPPVEVSVRRIARSAAKLLLVATDHAPEPGDATLCLRGLAQGVRDLAAHFDQVLAKRAAAVSPAPTPRSPRAPRPVKPSRPRR